MLTASLVPSPCRNICRLESGICTGCGRTGEEIASWPTASDPVRLQIRARADARLSAARPRR